MASSASPSNSSSCPYDAAASLHDLWLNYSSFAFNGNVALYDDYVCNYAGYRHLRQISQPIERQLIIIFSTFGFLGGLLTVLTLSQKRFRVLDFQLYRLIGYLEMGQMLDLAIMDLLAFMQCDTNYACTFLWAHVGFVFMNVCADAIDLLVLFLCVERTVACLLPHYFQRVHARLCYVWVFGISLALPTFFNAFSAFELTIVYDDNRKHYRGEPSEFRLSEFYAKITHVNTARFYIMAALIMIATAFSLWGFCAVARRRRLLTNDYSTMCSRNGIGTSAKGTRSWRSYKQRWPMRGTERGGASQREPISSAGNGASQRAPIRSTGNGASQREPISSTGGGGSQRGPIRGTKVGANRTQPITKDGDGLHQPRSGSGSRGGRKVKKREMELCCLQLCLAVPIIINHVLYATAVPNMNYEFVVSDAVFNNGVDYSTAMMELERARVFYYLRMATNLTNVLAHALHFYLYVMFSVQVRHAFFVLLRKCRERLSPKKYGSDGLLMEKQEVRVSPDNEISAV